MTKVKRMYELTHTDPSNSMNGHLFSSELDAIDWMDQPWNPRKEGYGYRHVIMAECPCCHRFHVPTSKP